MTALLNRFRQSDKPIDPQRNLKNRQKVLEQVKTLRFILYRNGYAPYRYVPLLDYAAECILLRKVGGRYIFIHRLLLDHLAEKWPAAGQ